MANMLIIIFTVFAIFAVSCIYKFVQGLQAVGYTPGFRCALSPFSDLSMALPTSFSTVFTNIGINFVWEYHRSKTQTKRGLDITSVVSWLHGPPTIYVSSVELMRQILRYPDNFDKQAYDPVSVLLGGDNIVSTQRDKWKVHRRVLYPAFSQKLNVLVWKESIRNFYQMLGSEGWEGKSFVHTPVVNSLVSKFTFSIILSCAFGLPFKWIEPKDIPEELSLQECVMIMASNFSIRMLAPRWAYLLPIATLKRVDAGFTKLFSIMRSQIALRRDNIQNEAVADDDDLGKNVIFDNIVRASVDGGKFALNEGEVTGNTFVMLFAGHETVSRTLTGVLSLLGLYTDEQEKAYLEIEQVLSNHREPTIQDFESFKYLQNIIQETMRLYPPVPLVVREAVQDTRLTVTTSEKIQEVIIKKGTLACVNILGIHYDPRYYPEPEMFKPSRWDDRSISSDAFLGFSHGTRACIGRRFALVEMTCFLVMLLRDWRVGVDLADGETPEQWRYRVLTAQANAVHGLGPVAIRFTKRK